MLNTLQNITEQKFSSAWMSTPQGYAYANVSQSTFERMKRQGLKFSKIGQICRFRKEDIDAFMMEHMTTLQPASVGGVL